MSDLPDSLKDMIAAIDTEPGKFYRKSRPCETGGSHYYVRPRLTAKAWAKRMEKKYNAMKGNEMHHYSAWKRNKKMVLMQSRIRGLCPISGERYELKNYVMMDPDTRLREVKKPPGFTRKNGKSKKT